MKKILLSLFVLGLSFLGFSNAGNYTYTGTVDLHGFANPTYFFSLTVPYANGEDFYATDSNNRSHTTVDVDLTCTFSNISLSKSSFYVSMVGYYVNKISWSNINLGTKNYLSSSTYTYNFTNRFGVIRVGWGESANLDSPYNIKFDYSCTFSGEDIISSISCTNYTSEECQTEYDLIPIINLTSCQSDLQNCQASTSGFNSLLNNCSNNLNACNTSLSSCLQNNCPVSSGDINWSTLFINNIQHLGAGIINITIPEEISWDYSGTDEQFNLDIMGYNTDSDYIAGIITTQKFTPDSSDFQKIITDVLPLFVPGLVIILFIYYIFRLIKKLF